MDKFVLSSVLRFYFSSYLKIIKEENLKYHKHRVTLPWRCTMVQIPPK